MKEVNKHREEIYKDSPGKVFSAPDDGSFQCAVAACSAQPLQYADRTASVTLSLFIFGMDVNKYKPAMIWNDDYWQRHL